MNILEIYKKYQIMPQLQQHQLKVAAVAEVIFNHSSLILDRREIIVACLLHDMGNIVKFDLSVTDKLNPGEFTKDDLKYWQAVKDEYVQKYGTDAHHATTSIVRELGVEERIIELIDCISFLGASENTKSIDFGRKICAYSDVRVEPQGVVSLEERFKGLRHRYRNYSPGEYNREIFENALREIEKQIFAKCEIRPEDITEAAVEPFVGKLKGLEIKISTD